MKKSFLLLFVLSALFLFSGEIKAQDNNSINPPQDGETYYKAKEVDQTSRILSHISASPKSPSGKNCDKISGQATLRVYYHRSGTVSKVGIITPSTCDIFDKNAIEAAQKLKFNPAIKNGQAVSYTGIVVYHWKFI